MGWQKRNNNKKKEADGLAPVFKCSALLKWTRLARVIIHSAAAAAAFAGCFIALLTIHFIREATRPLPSSPLVMKRLDRNGTLFLGAKFGRRRRLVPLLLCGGTIDIVAPSSSFICVYVSSGALVIVAMIFMCVTDAREELPLHPATGSSRGRREKGAPRPGTAAVVALRKPLIFTALHPGCITEAYSAVSICGWRSLPLEACHDDDDGSAALRLQMELLRGRVKAARLMCTAQAF